MFDSRITEWAPGQVRRFGLPWHGLKANNKREFEGRLETLTLDNGRVIQLGPGVFDTFGGVVGNSYRYSDPRAVPIEMTPEEAAVWDEAGAQWRTDGLLPHQFAGRWVYFDGEQNWRVELVNHQANNPTLNLRRTAVIGPEIPFPPNPVVATVAVQSLSPPPAIREALAGTAREGVIVMQTPTGDRALWITRRNAQFGLRDYQLPIYELWEYVLTTIDGEISCQRTLLWDMGEALDSFELSDTRPGLPPYLGVDASAFWTLESATDEGANVLSEFEWTLTEVSSPTRMLISHERNIVRRYTGVLATAYYDDEQNVCLVTVNATATSDSVAVTTGSLIEDRQGSAFVGRSLSGGSTEYFWNGIESVTPPEYTLQLTMNYQVSSAVVFDLIDAGVVVSQFRAQGTGSQQRVERNTWDRCGFYNDARNFDIVAPPGYGPQSPSDGAVLQNNVTHTESFSLDDVVFASGSESTTSQVFGLDAVWYAIQLALPTSAMLVNFGISMNMRTESAQIVVRPVHYNLAMPALMGSYRPTDLPEDRRYRVGRIACRGEVLPGLFAYNGPDEDSGFNNFGLFGAWNAVTGQWVRDAVAHVEYI